MEVEGAKIAASDAGQGGVALGWVEPGLAANLDHAGLVAQTEELSRRIAERIGRCLNQAGLPAEGIDALFLTGGSTGLPHVRAALVAGVPNARVVDGDTFGSVGTGLTIEAGRRAG